MRLVGGLVRIGGRRTSFRWRRRSREAEALQAGELVEFALPDTKVAVVAFLGAEQR